MTTVFTYGRHPAYLYLLSHCDAEFVIPKAWEEDTRPRPNNVRYITESEVPAALAGADVWLSHLITPDLLYFIRSYTKVESSPRIIQIMHGRADRAGTIRSGPLALLYRTVKQQITPILDVLPQALDIEYVYITDYVAQSWGMSPGTVIYPGALLDEIELGSHSESYPLTVGNDLGRPHFAGDILSELNNELEMWVCGANDSTEYSPGYVSWTELISLYQSCCCYLNLLRPPENSFNLATIEAMCAGTPIITLSHPKSIFTHRKNALVCESVEEIVYWVERLKSEKALRMRLGTAARSLAEEMFSMESFIDNWESLLHS
ncbi:glycosyltransferase family protein [Haloarcula rubripromontorii]|uniref:glycosyltransferase family protein n=1 Tax=Haloarcula rubripromontorii TaxID=1705562 RepID=UPI00345BB71C